MIDRPPPTSEPAARPARRDPAAFDLPDEALRRGDYSDIYFVRAAQVLAAEGRDPGVTLQCFQKRHALLAGIDEALAILRRGLAPGYGWSDLEVLALAEGDSLAPWETALEVTGPYRAFAHLETLMVGVLSRRTRIATNTRQVVEAAAPRPVLYFPARHDHWSLQEGDGWAAHLAGAHGVSTPAQGAWWGGTAQGTIPHALIAAFGGDTVAATRAFARTMPDDVDVIALVDFDNDVVRTSLEVARALGDRLAGVRLDTSEALVDRSLWDAMGDFDPRGVNPVLVDRVRSALDGEGFGAVRIVCSGGFDADRIRSFVARGTPVDAWGVGSALLRGGGDFTADVVLLEGQPAAKVGRWHRPNPRLLPVG